MGTAVTNGFSVQETHGILLRSENQIRVQSDGLGWSDLYASNQREAPYEAHFGSVRDHLIILHRDGLIEMVR